MQVNGYVQLYGGIVLKFRIIAEVREEHPSFRPGEKIYNDYVSQKSMLDLEKGIASLGYDCKYLGGMKELYQIYKSKSCLEDTIFINYNYGLPAQYKRVQSPALLELMQAKYSGADPFVSLLVNDKAYCKKVLSNLTILSPKGYLLCNALDTNAFFASTDLELPLVIKPNMEGSSLGIDEQSFCISYNAAKEKVCNLLNTFPQVLVEEYIEGYECTVWMIGNQPDFPLIKPLIISSSQKYYFENKIFTLNDKSNHTRKYDLPSNILPSSIVTKLESLSKQIFNELGLRDYARIDFRINNNKIYFIEANALPIFSKTSEIGAITQLYSIPYEEICHILVTTLLKRLMGKTD